MKIYDLIEKLEDFKAKHGDLDVARKLSSYSTFGRGEYGMMQNLYPEIIEMAVPGTGKTKQQHGIGGGMQTIVIEPSEWKKYVVIF